MLKTTMIIIAVITTIVNVITIVINRNKNRQIKAAVPNTNKKENSNIIKRMQEAEKEYNDLLSALYENGVKSFGTQYIVTDKYAIINFTKYKITKEEYDIFDCCKHVVITGRKYTLVENEVPQNLFIGSKKSCKEFICEVKNNLSQE